MNTDPELTRSERGIPPRSAGLRPAVASYIQDPVALLGASGLSPKLWDVPNSFRPKDVAEQLRSWGERTREPR